LVSFFSFQLVHLEHSARSQLSTFGLLDCHSFQLSVFGLLDFMSRLVQLALGFGLSHSLSHGYCAVGGATTYTYCCLHLPSQYPCAHSQPARPSVQQPVSSAISIAHSQPARPSVSLTASQLGHQYNSQSARPSVQQPVSSAISIAHSQPARPSVQRSAGSAISIAHSQSSRSSASRLVFQLDRLTHHFLGFKSLLLWSLRRGGRNNDINRCIRRSDHITNTVSTTTVTSQLLVSLHGHCVMGGETCINKDTIQHSVTTCTYQHRSVNPRLLNTARHLVRFLGFTHSAHTGPISSSAYPHLQPARVAPYALPMVRGHHMSRETVAPTSDIAPIIVVANSRPLATPRHTRDSQLDPVCTMTRILNNPTRFPRYYHSLLVSPSHSSVVPALTFDHQHCALVSRILYTITTLASRYTNYLHIVPYQSPTSLVRSPQTPSSRGQPCHQHHAVNTVTSTTRSTHSTVLLDQLSH